MKTYPFHDVVEALLARRLEGWHYCLQFNCAKCKAKQTIDQLDTMFELGRCEECGHVTNLKVAGLNYMLFGDGKTDLSRLSDLGPALVRKRRR